MRSLVVDCSTAIAWTMLDESSTLADAALERLRAWGGVAPQIWWAELRNALLAAERRGRVPPAGTDAALAALDDLPIVLDRTPSGAMVLRIAREHDLTVYDAMYLELALRLNCPLATLDRKLAMAAAEAGGTVFSADA
ncbi:MAG: type II toxin-antitoxin system VapC family toxin [Gemmatimonadota bacterium]|uniref:type II toxin-antitoxin system VapC family toxin n=1 Tax=Candidatus Palauibacter scopulicola TaxID=3056741 RepID=UPI0023907E69|nr:type II toxin-antitoxin system VapC family toxin [Candidatus Palauibacter scopulicola]MDE2661504.1 type II toxin-antitoxin system VapC family toxin [Candidatus Palauibacter scopulicola]